MRNHIIIYQIPWDNSPQQVSEELARTAPDSLSECPFVRPHTNKQFAI